VDPARGELRFAARTPNSSPIPKRWNYQNCQWTVPDLSAYRLLMKSSTDHIPPRKQRELSRILEILHEEILHEEFEDALKQGTANFKKRGRILKIVLFGSYDRPNHAGFELHQALEQAYACAKNNR
jgi:hypothetical protein